MSEIVFVLYFVSILFWKLIRYKLSLGLLFVLFRCEMAMKVNVSMHLLFIHCGIDFRVQSASGPVDSKSALDNFSSHC